MALPWMESIPVWGAKATAAVDAGSQAPIRFGVLFSGNGFHTEEWWAKGQGKQIELGKVLAPISDFREKLLFVRGLYNEEALKGNIHSSMTGNLLSGAPLASGGAIRSGTSIDQIIAQRYGRSTKVPSLVLGCERSNPGIHKDYSMLYSSHISWSSPTAPTRLWNSTLHSPSTDSSTTKWSGVTAAYSTRCWMKRAGSGATSVPAIS